MDEAVLACLRDHTGNHVRARAYDCLKDLRALNRVRGSHAWCITEIARIDNGTSSLFAKDVLAACVAPCFKDHSKMCCAVPKLFSSWFPCCMALGRQVTRPGAANALLTFYLAFYL